MALPPPIPDGAGFSLDGSSQQAPAQQAAPSNLPPPIPNGVGFQHDAPTPAPQPTGGDNIQAYKGDVSAPEDAASQAGADIGAGLHQALDYPAEKLASVFGQGEETHKADVAAKQKFESTASEGDKEAASGIGLAASMVPALAAPELVPELGTGRLAGLATSAAKNAVMGGVGQAFDQGTNGTAGDVATAAGESAALGPAVEYGAKAFGTALKSIVPSMRFQGPQAVKDVLENSNMSPGAMRQAINTPVSPKFEGDQRTLASNIPDNQVALAQRQAEMASPQPFQARNQAQQQAMQGALEKIEPSSAVGAADVGNELKSQIADINNAHVASINDILQKNGINGDVSGMSPSDAVKAANDAITQHVEGLGSESDAKKIGDNMRAAIDGATKSAKSESSRLWNIFDAHDVTVDGSPVADAAKGIEKLVPKDANLGAAQDWVNKVKGWAGQGISAKDLQFYGSQISSDANKLYRSGDLFASKNLNTLNDAINEARNTGAIIKPGSEGDLAKDLQANRNRWGLSSQDDVDAAAQARNAAAASTRTEKGISGPGTTVGDALKTDRGRYDMASNEVPGAFWQKNGAGLNSMQNLSDRLGPQGAQAVIRDQAAASLRDAAFSNGKLDPLRFAKWQKDYAPALSHTPGIASEFNNIGAAQSSLDRINDVSSAAAAAYEKGELSRWIGQDSDKAVKGLFQGQDANAKAERLINRIGASPNAMEGLRREVFTEFVNRLSAKNDAVQGLTGVIMPAAKSAGTLRNHLPMLEKVLTPDQMTTIKGIVEAQKADAAVVDRATYKGGSNTARELSAMKKQEQKATGPGSMVGAVADAGMTAMGTVLGHLPGGFMGHVMAEQGKELINQFAKAGIRNKQDLISRMYSNPDFAREMLRKYDPSKIGQTAQRLGKLAVAGNIGRRNNKLPGLGNKSP